MKNSAGISIRSSERPGRGNKRKRGAVLITAVATLAAMVGLLGLAFDGGRMFIVKNELQMFADASALAAVTQLEGTRAGVVHAHTIATEGPLGTARPNGWNFDTIRITDVTDTYAASFKGAYDSYATASGSLTNSYRFVKVTAQAKLPMYFLSVVPGIGAQYAISASGTAGHQTLAAAGNGGLIPFSPSAHDPADTKNFGLIPGLQYSLKWGNGNTTTCAGDLGFNPGNAPSAHGFVDIGQGSNSNSALRDVIIYGAYPNPSSTLPAIGAGTVLDGVPANRGGSIFTATADRSAQDPDQTSLTWAAYQAAGIGNYRRIVTAPIHDPALNSGSGGNFQVTVVGFGNFLLDPALLISGSSGPICATYIGPGNLSGASSGASDGTKIYSSTLFQ